MPQDIGVRFEIELRQLRCPVLLDLMYRRVGDAPVGNGGGEDGDIDGKLGFAGLQHLARALDMNHPGARRVRLMTGAGNQHGFRPQLRQCRGDRVALLAR